MALKALAIAAGVIVAASPALASNPDPDPMAGAPAASPTTKYCLHVEPRTGSLIERVQCWTREDWAEQGVDVDKEWAKEGAGVRE